MALEGDVVMFPPDAEPEKAVYTQLLQGQSVLIIRFMSLDLILLSKQSNRPQRRCGCSVSP